jgi:formiminoglutamase
VSLDMDAIDSAQAPGVSAANPAGMSVGEVSWALAGAGRSPWVACFDIMELNPVFDVDGRTARAATHCLLSFLRGLAERRV